METRRGSEDTQNKKTEDWRRRRRRRASEDNRGKTVATLHTDKTMPASIPEDPPSTPPDKIQIDLSHTDEDKLKKTTAETSSKPVSPKENSPLASGIITNMINTIHNVLRTDKTHTRQRSTDNDSHTKPEEKELKPKPTEPTHTNKHSLVSVFHNAMHTLDKSLSNHHAHADGAYAGHVRTSQTDEQPSSHHIKPTLTQTPLDSAEPFTDTHSTPTIPTVTPSILLPTHIQPIGNSTVSPPTQTHTVPVITPVHNNANSLHSSPQTATPPPHTHDDTRQAASQKQPSSSQHNRSFSSLHSDLHVNIPSSPIITGSPRLRSNVSPQLGILQRRASLRTHSPLSLSSASVAPPDWESRMGLDPWGLEESIAKLGEEKKKEEERRKEELRKEEERRKDEARKEEERHEAKAKEEAEREKLEKRRQRDKGEPRRVVFQRAVSPPPPSSPTRGSDGSDTPPSPGRARLVSSAMNMKVFSPFLYLLFCFLGFWFWVFWVFVFCFLFFCFFVFFVFCLFCFCLFFFFPPQFIAQVPLLELKPLSLAGSSPIPVPRSPAPTLPSDSENETGTGSYYSDQDDAYLLISYLM
jgi:hypothetical protein